MASGWDQKSITESSQVLYDPAVDGKCAAIRIANTGNSPMHFNVEGIHKSSDSEGLAAGAEVLKRAGNAAIGKVRAFTTTGQTTTSDGGIAAAL